MEEQRSVKKVAFSVSFMNVLVLTAGENGNTVLKIVYILSLYFNYLKI